MRLGLLKTDAAVFLATCAAVLLLAFLGLIMTFGSEALSGPVHEDGNKTLWETLTAPRHFLREVPIGVLLGWACAAGWAGWGPRGARLSSPAPALGGGLLLFSMIAVAWYRVSASEGSATAAMELLQGYTRDDLRQSGGHWRYHLGSTALALALVPVFAWLASQLDRRPSSRGVSWQAYAWTLLGFVALSIGFGIDQEVFTHPRVLGHQARECSTLVLLTLPFVFAVLATYVPPSGGSCTTRIERVPRSIIVCFSIATSLGLGLLVASLVTGSLAYTQPGAGWASLVANHFFEHVADTVLAAAAAVFCSWPLQKVGGI